MFGEPKPEYIEHQHWKKGLFYTLWTLQSILTIFQLIWSVYFYSISPPSNPHKQPNTKPIYLMLIVFTIILSLLILHPIYRFIRKSLSHNIMLLESIFVFVMGLGSAMMFGIIKDLGPVIPAVIQCIVAIVMIGHVGRVSDVVSKREERIDADRGVNVGAVTRAGMRGRGKDEGMERGERVELELEEKGPKVGIAKRASQDVTVVNEPGSSRTSVHSMASSVTEVEITEPPMVVRDFTWKE